MKARTARLLSIVLAVLAVVPGALAAKEVRVVYLNPGHYVRDAGWTQRSWFMEAAAAQLGYRLEVLYAGRDRLRMVEQAREIAARKTPPDYAVVVNEMEEGPQLLEAFRGTRTRVLLMHNDLTAEQREQVGGERGRLANWIGSIVTDERAAARAMIGELYRRAGAAPQVLGVSGPEATPASVGREEAVRAYIEEAGGRLLQVVPGNWTREDGKEKAAWLLSRHPQANVFWGVNDTVALGIHDAVVESGRKDAVVVGGVGGFPKALDSVAHGGLAVSAGGNGFIGAWAMVLIHDYHRGLDFADGGANAVIQSSTVAVITDASSANRFRQIIEQPERVDFRRFSRAENRALKAYDFSYQAVLKAFR